MNERLYVYNKILQPTSILDKRLKKLMDIHSWIQRMYLELHTVLNGEFILTNGSDNNEISYMYLDGEDLQLNPVDRWMVV